MPAMKRNTFLVLGAINGFLSVAFGAFGAHALKTRVDAAMLAVFHTGVEYHAVHALALLATGLLLMHQESVWLRRAGWLFALGILLFSGSLYLLAISSARGLGMVTPFGGLAFLAGWAALTIAALKHAR